MDFRSPGYHPRNLNMRIYFPQTVFANMMITLTLQKVQDTGEIPLEVNNIKILWLNRTPSDDCVTDAGNGNRYQPRSNFVGQR